MQRFFRVDVDPLVIGGPDHRTYVALYLTLLVLLLSARDLVRRHEELVRGGLVVVSLAQQVAMYAFHLYRGDRWADALPLHICRVLLPVYAALTSDWRPTLRGLGESYLAFLGYLLVVELTNRRTGGNYFYLQDRPVLRTMPHRRYLALTLAGTLGLFGTGYAVSRVAGALARRRVRSYTPWGI